MSAVQDIFPRERIPKNAVLTPAMFRGERGPARPSFIDNGCSKFVTSGTMAIKLCLAHAGVGGGDTVLLPAYHCISMVEPVLWRGARPIFYRVNEDTSIDLADIASKLDRTTRMLVAPHYFGFPQNATRIREFCDQHRLLFLEDCAHAFFGSYAGRPLGSFGDYAIASPWKFFPAFDGGLLSSRRMDLRDAPLAHPSLYYHCKAALNTLEYAFEYGRLTSLKNALSLPLKAKSYLWRKAAKAPVHASDVTATQANPSSGWKPDWTAEAMSWPSRLTIARANMTHIAESRRHHYQRLDAALHGIRGCRALFTSLSENIVPQVFPMVMDDPGRVFPLLKRAGVPIIRFGEFLWPGVDASTCAHSVELSRRVFQFPCHQDLRADELDWMINAIVNVMESA